jgi:NAD+ diphosphatase
MNGHNVFAGAFVDRSGHRRGDAAWLAETFTAPETRFVPVWRGKCLVTGEPPHIALLEHRRVDAFVSSTQSIFLGMFDGRPAFAFEMDSEDAPFSGRGEFHDLRYLGTILPAAEANLVAHAIALVNWHRKQLFCGACGAQAEADPGGNTRSCTSCPQQYFPRVDPAIIVLVSDEDRALLGRQASWPEGRYSTIAGFVEPGESLEDAVRREVLEETDIRVGDVRYHSSQPWPFPSSLMLGFTASATSTGIRLNDGELEDARWFTRKECRSGFPKLPFRLSIARRLVDDWLDRE